MSAIEKAALSKSINNENDIKTLKNSRYYHKKYYCTNSGVPLGRYTNTTEWTNTSPSNLALSIDTVNCKKCSKALKMTSLTTSETVMDMTISQNLYLFNKEIRFSFYLHNAPTKYSSIWVYLSSTPWTKFFSINLKNFTLYQGWNYLRLNSSNVWGNTGTESWDNTFTTIRWKFTSNDAEDLGAITIDDVSANVTHEGRVIFTFDDGYSNNCTEAFPIMEQYGFKGTIYVNPFRVDSEERFLTLTQCKTLYNAGWDIASHGYNHIAYNDATPEETEADIANAKAWLLANGFTRSMLHFGVPNGQDTADLQTSLVNNGYLTSRNSIYNSFYADKLTSSALPSQPIKNTNLIQYVENIIENAKTSGKTVILMFHRVETDDTGDEYGWSTEKFSDLCEILYNRGIVVVPISEWYNGLGVV